MYVDCVESPDYIYNGLEIDDDVAASYNVIDSSLINSTSANSLSSLSTNPIPAT